MTRDDKKKELMQAALADGNYTEPDVNSFIAKMAKNCPDAVATEKGLTDEIDKAYEALMIERGQANIGGDARQTTTPTAMPAASITAEESQSIRNKIAADYTQMLQVSQSAVIEKVVFDKPEPAELIAAGTTGMISEKSWKNIQEQYADKVLDDDPDDAANCVKSRTNYNALKAAFDAGTPVKVYIGKGSTKPVAVHLRMPGTNNQAKTEILSMPELEATISLKAAGYIMATDTTVGAKMRYIKSTPDKQNPGAMKPERSILAITHKAEAIAAGNALVSRVVTNDIKQDASCKSELAFRVDTGKPKQNGGGNITRLVRVTVNAPVKGMSRKPEYVKVLGAGDGKSGAGDLLTPPDPKAMQAITTAQVTKIAELKRKVASGDDFNAQVKYGDVLSGFGIQSAPAASVTV